MAIFNLYMFRKMEIFIYGDMFNISSDGIINLTDKDILQKRKLLMQEISNEELISFKAKNELLLLLFLLMLTADVKT